MIARTSSLCLQIRCLYESVTFKVINEKVELELENLINDNFEACMV